MKRVSCVLAAGALLLLSACNQGGQTQQAKADQLAPHPLAGAPATPASNPPKLSVPATPPAEQQATVPPAGADAPADAAGAMQQEQLPQIPADELAQMEKSGLAEIKKQIAKGPHTATDFEFVGFDGKPGKLSAQYGQPLVVNFWAPWCPPCKMELPDFQAVYNSKPGQFKLIGVCSDDSSDPPGYVQQHGYNWTFVYDKDNQGGKAYHIQSIPRTLFINRKGQIVVDWTAGLMPKKAFEAALAKIL